MIRSIDLDEFTLAYITCALWASTDGSDERTGGEPMDSNYSINDIADETITEMRNDCERFQRENAADIIDENYIGNATCGHVEYAGHDFWLTRNHHGCGFWDGDWSEPAATRLDEASKKFGEYNLYIGDDGKVYGAKG